MSSLFLNDKEKQSICVVLEKMEKQYNAEYSFIPKTSVYSCKCSGPGQSCVWH